VRLRDLFVSLTVVEFGSMGGLPPSWAWRQPDIRLKPPPVPWLAYATRAATRRCG